MKIAFGLAVWSFAAALTAGPALADCDPRPDGVDPDIGYRVGHYSAPVPECAPGAPNIGFEEAKRLHDAGGAVFVDVTPIDGSDPDPFDGTWAVPEPHMSVPGAIWLPEAGRGKPEPWLENYLRDNLDRLIAASPGKPVIVFCRSDCWGSWNAAKRAASWGYANLRWYAEGIGDWEANKLPLEQADPVPAEVN